MSSIPLETVADAETANQVCAFRVMLIASHEPIANNLREVIEPLADVDFVHCRDPSKAPDLARQLLPTVILLDVQMPGSCGLDLVKLFRATPDLCDIPIIALVGDDNPAGRDDLFLAGANDYVASSRGDVEIIARVYYHSRSFVSRRRLLELADELEKSQNQLYQSEKMSSIGVLAAGVAHEINNPIAFVTSNLNSLSQYFQEIFRVFDTYVEIETSTAARPADFKQVIELKRQLKMDAVRQDANDILDECRDGLGRVRKIVDDLKNFSRTGEAVWLWTDVHTELDRTLSIANNEIKYKAEVIKHYGDLPKIQCIPSQLNQVFLNLLVNAAQAIQGRGEITIRTTTGAGPPDPALADAGKNGWVCVQISDTGSGIDADTLTRIFEPFFTTKAVDKGTGLGLSISCGLIKGHNGSIAAESHLGVGTTFTIWLPVEQINQ